MTNEKGLTVDSIYLSINSLILYQILKGLKGQLQSVCGKLKLERANWLQKIPCGRVTSIENCIFGLHLN